MPIILPGAADSGATLADLRGYTLTQSFSSTRYSTLINRWLNDAVLEVCRRLNIIQGAEILAFDATGRVSAPSLPFFRVREAWLCTPQSTGFDEAAIALAAMCKLHPMPWDQAINTSRIGAPQYYSTKRGSTTAVEVRVITTAPGKVGIVGQQRPEAMLVDTDISGLGADLDDALVAFAKARAFRQEDDFEMSNAWKGEFELSLRTAAFDPADDEPQVTPGTWNE